MGWYLVFYGISTQKFIRHNFYNYLSTIIIEIICR